MTASVTRMCQRPGRAGGHHQPHPGRGASKSAVASWLPWPAARARPWRSACRSSMTLSWNVQGKKAYGGELKFRPAQATRPRRTPHPPRPRVRRFLPTPTVTVTPEPVISTVPGTTRRSSSPRRRWSRRSSPRRHPAVTGVLGDGSWTLVVLGLLLVGGVLKCSRHTGRRHWVQCGRGAGVVCQRQRA